MLLTAAMVLITPGIVTDTIGISLVTLVVLSQKFISRKEATPDPSFEQRDAKLEPVAIQSGKAT
jgi:UPF0716 family protein affecting phage T7 exclusion